MLWVLLPGRFFFPYCAQTLAIGRCCSFFFFLLSVSCNKECVSIGSLLCSFCFFQLPYRGDLCSTSASAHKSVLKSYYSIQSFAAWTQAESRCVCVCDWQVAIMQHAAAVTQGLDCKLVKFGVPDDVISTVPHSTRVPLSSRCSLLQRIKTKEFSKCSPGLIGKPPPASLFFLLEVLTGFVSLSRCECGSNWILESKMLAR